MKISNCDLVIFGGSGLLGSSLIHFYQHKGIKFMAPSHECSYPTNVDITRKDALFRFLDKSKPKFIINLVALTSVDDCEANKELAYLLNVRAVKNIADWIRSDGMNSHLVHISSDQVYSGHGPHNELNPAPLNYYGKTKLLSEAAALRVDATVLRTNFFGHSLNPKRKSFSDWIIDSLYSCSKINVFDDILFSPLMVDTLLDLIDMVAVSRIEGVFNLGSKDGMSKADFAFKLADLMELPTVNLNRVNSKNLESSGRVIRPSDMRMNSIRFEETFRVELPSLNEEIQKLINKRQQK